MKRRKKIYLGAGALAMLVIAALALSGGGKEVETVLAQKGQITRAVVESGYIQPATDFGIHATQSVRVTQIPVEAGESVKQGQTLVVLENLDLSIQISEARSQLTQAASAVSGARASMSRTQLDLQDARDNLQRSEELYQAGALARVDYDKALLQVESLQQTIVEQNSRLDNALTMEAGLSNSLRHLAAKEQQLVVKSPVDGTVLNIAVKREQVLHPGSLLVNVAVPDQLEVKADILSDDLAEIKLGQKVSVTAPVLGSSVLTGEVKKIYPRAEEKQSALGIIQRRVPVIISLPGPGKLKPGYEVKVAIETQSRQDVLILPREAVRSTRDGGKEVLCVVNNKIERRKVQTGLSDQKNIEITDGLENGDRVVKDAGLDLAEKTKIKVMQ